MIPDRSELHGGDEEIVNRALSRAKGAWAASLREDDRLYRDASEERLAASWPRPRVLPVRSFVLGAAAAACVAAIAFVAVRSSDGAQLARAKEVVASAPAPTASPAAPFVAPIAPLSTATVTTATATSPEARAAVTTRGIVATGACPDCRVGGSAMEPGITIGAGRALTVPRGARVTLGFALGEGAPDSTGTTTRSLVDPAVGVDVEGPAVATLPDDGTISLDRGSARFRGLRDIAVAVPGGRLDSSGATFTVRIDGQGIARI
ncbi:MAG: hypothetical protein QOI41_2190, partial [Myxococcales bacterium]|nr:hypothetical protein [Myxococcales bacterium]